MTKITVKRCEYNSIIPSIVKNYIGVRYVTNIEGKNTFA